MTEFIRSRDGKCCACGYTGDEETKCPQREDGGHCVHWWERPKPTPPVPKRKEW